MNQYQDTINKVLTAFSLGKAEQIAQLGGTATKKFSAQTPKGKFVVRIRPSDFASQTLTIYDHTILQDLCEMNLPVPYPMKKPDGTTWIKIDEDVFEVLSWVEGNYFDYNDIGSLKSLGNFLGRFHSIPSEKIPAGKENWPREDHPDLLRQYITLLLGLCKTDSEKQQIKNVDAQLDIVKQTLDPIYNDLPKAVIHGDIHPGNVYFNNSKVSAVYDFDYLSTQARVRDISDGIMFFAAKRNSPLIADDIYSLTSPFKLDIDRSVNLLKCYHDVNPIKASEIKALPMFMRSRWCQIRLRGCRKVEESKKLSFVLDNFFDMITHLDSAGPEFTKNIIQSLKI